MTTPPRIGILGGTFDPIHFGHLRLAEAARDALALDRVILVPAAHQPLKGAGSRAPAEDRLEMARRAATERPWLDVSDVEVRRGGPSYTVESLRALRAALGPDARLFFIAGADVLRDLDRWYRVDEVLSLATFVAATRPGHAIAIPERFAGRVTPLPFEALPVSATEVRRRLAAGDPALDLLPRPVADYIRARGLYRDLPERPPLPGPRTA